MCADMRARSSMTKTLRRLLYWWSHARVRKSGNDSYNQPTCDVDVHDAGASPDAVGGVTNVRSSQVIGHWPLEEQGVVLDLRISGQGAIQAAVRKTGNNADMIKTTELLQTTEEEKEKNLQDAAKHFKPIKEILFLMLNKPKCACGGRINTRNIWQRYSSAVIHQVQTKLWGQGFPTGQNR